MAAIYVSGLKDTIIMNLLRSWREQKILLKRMFSNLTDEDFVYKDGEKEFMLERLRDKLGKSKTELELIFEEIQLS
jgi:hypothetical protein